MIEIFIVDDHQIFRDGLKLLIDNTDDMVVVGESESGKEAIEKLEHVVPSLILMDIQMPGQNGIDVTRELKRRNPAHKILMLTMFEDEQSVFASMQAGALGYVLKGINHVEMLQTIRIAADGGAVFSPKIADYILKWFAKQSHEPPAEEPIELPMLTKRETETLKLLAAGCDNYSIAEALTVTEKTVRNYVSQLLKKLEVSDRGEAGLLGRQAGLQ